MLRLTLLLLLIISVNNTIAQKKKLDFLEGAGEVQILDSDLTKSYYKNKATKIAKNNALYKFYGTTVNSSYNRLSTTKVASEKIIDSHKEFRISNTIQFPNGQWIKDKSKAVCEEYSDSKGYDWIKCKVTGYGRRIETSQTQFEAELLDGVDKSKNISEKFSSEENLYVHFKSAEDGYLLILLTDFNDAYKILPSYNSRLTKFKITANKDYLFFDADGEIANQSLVQPYTNKEVELNQVYFIFSKNEFDAPLFNDFEKDQQGLIPPSLSYKDFNNWIQKERTRNQHIQIKIMDLLISK